MGGVNRIRNAFNDEGNNTQNSNMQETNSLGSTVSLQTFAMEPPMEYEEIIQKLESDIRKHIRIQNQLKLHIESLQAKVDENEKEVTTKSEENDKLKEDVKKLKQSLIDLDRKKESEIKSIKDHNQNEVK